MGDFSIFNIQAANSYLLFVEVPLSTPARDGAYKFLRKPQETAPCQRAKERASVDIDNDLNSF